jgi:hypothetical protein
MQWDKLCHRRKVDYVKLLLSSCSIEMYRNLFENSTKEEISIASTSFDDKSLQL